LLEIDLNNPDMHPIYLYTNKAAYSDMFPEFIKPIFSGLRRDSRVHYDGVPIRPKKMPH